MGLGNEMLALIKFISSLKKKKKKDARVEVEISKTDISIPEQIKRKLPASLDVQVSEKIFFHSLGELTHLTAPQAPSTGQTWLPCREQGQASHPGKIPVVVEVLRFRLVEQCTACSLKSGRVCVRA